MNNKMMLAGQILTSEMGFKVLSVTDCINGFPVPDNMIKFKEIQDWCKKNCSGIWGYSTNPTAMFMHANKFNSQNNRIVIRYFAFIEREDITAISYFMGITNVTARAMWPARTAFNIFIPENVDLS